ncbi:hypothetical protein EMIHUDRAFT_242716 [Emiliania huxleyi CCMP1516]|uniref:Isopenicillin N synthase-like Fe(2+) 2OG dioxygenase domain-containing protein n=2 Tax=Emiliania huxleyi TaxID=2903 RepID=A0A0D3J891_EMIH1|nr:hypothetical protein EMIHUDRAFT_242716 [Emiliania huxleyi CCMP1516]EOD19726.1 hypothetical protein EMIHUDRAFT_242716 [Emiliania huxleyi CCMP1516]|eukprot:XP_005772155.1 hypothetical protein EMIHUDRAFT_242716 [Emiliania huxleyi CCMP1516]
MARDDPRFAAAHTLWAEDGQCTLRLLHYPPARRPAHGLVDPVEGGIAVNIGDMLSRWSNDSLLSNLHRADKHVLIESRHGAITAGDYILGRIRSNFDKKG